MIGVDDADPATWPKVVKVRDLDEIRRAVGLPEGATPDEIVAAVQRVVAERDEARVVARRVADIALPVTAGEIELLRTARNLGQEATRG
ncbi:MAG: hypothetical protein ABL912_01735 [Novosphingobium sp.]